MKRIAILFVAGLSSLACAADALADDVRVIVGFKGRSDASLVSRHGGAAGTEIHSARALAAVVPAARLAALRADPDVAYVEEDGIVEALGQTTPWGVTRVGGNPSPGAVPGAGAGIDVAIIDTGIALTHADLSVSSVSKSFVSSAKNANDDNGHGSHVAGTVAALDNDLGVVGVAPGATLHAVKVLDRRGSGTWSAVAAGIDWCVANGIEIANMSLGGGSSATLQTACDNAEASGVLLVAAAGNSGDNTGYPDGKVTTSEWSYPAAYASVVSVGATDSSDRIATFSNTNSDVEVSAPGVSVYSTYKGGKYATLSGTSMACPHAVGVAALLWADAVQAATSPTNDSVRAALKDGVQDAGASGFDNAFGWGIVHHP